MRNNRQIVYHNKKEENTLKTVEVKKRLVVVAMTLILIGISAVMALNEAYGWDAFLLAAVLVFLFG